MASLKDIRKRIQTVKSTRQITRAMKMVAAAKLRRAQEAILNARPFAYRIYSILLALTEKEEAAKHPLLLPREEEKKVRVVVLAGDRGLCGAFNSNIFKAVQKFMRTKEKEGVEITLECVGKKSFDFFKKRKEMVRHHQNLLGRGSFDRTSTVVDRLLTEYKNGDYDAVYLVYNEFKSAIQQKVIVERLIPLSEEVPEGVVGILRNGDKDKQTEYLFEPSKGEILEEIVPLHFKMQLFRAVLESAASEHGARMSAMESATKNASEMIDGLTLQYNKARQASITKELMEIVGGVEAMR